MILLQYYHTKLLLYYICMFTYCQSFQRTSTFNIFKSQFVLCNNCEEQRRDLSHNKLHSNYKYYQSVKGAISSHFLFIYRAKTCSASLNSKISYLTLYLGIETISMGWMDMDWHLKTVSPTFSSLILCLKNPPHPRKKKYNYIYIIMVSAPDKICFISSRQLYTSINFCVWVLKGAK